MRSIQVYVDTHGWPTVLSFIDGEPVGGVARRPGSERAVARLGLRWLRGGAKRGMGTVSLGGPVEEVVVS